MEQCLRSTGQVAFHPVRFRYPNEITKAFHGAGRTGGINLSGLFGLSGVFGDLGFEEDEAEKQSDGDAYHVEDDIAGGGVTTGNRQLVDFIEGADDHGDSSRNEETELQAGRAPGSSPRRVAVRLNRSMFESSRDGHQ